MFIYVKCLYIKVRICVCILTFMYACIYVCMYFRMYVYIHDVFIYLCMHLCVHSHIYVFKRFNSFNNKSVSMQTCIFVYPDIANV